jgi:hypothetical protein
MTLTEVRNKVFPVAFALLPAAMNTKAAQVLLLTIGLQESRFEFRRQLGNGPARGFWQFEEGNAKSRAGVWGVMNHKASQPFMRELCEHFGLPFTTKAVWEALETNDVLACCTARLLMYTDAYKLPAVGDVEGAWKLYADRVWRPGKPHRSTWDAFYNQAVKEVG